MSKQIFSKINRYLNKRDYKEAESLLKELLGQNEDLPKVCIQLGWLYDQWALSDKRKDAKKKHQNLAKKYFRSAMTDKKEKRQAIRGLGTVLMHEGNYQKSLRYYKESYKIKKDFDTCNDLGNLYQKIGKYKLATRYYKKSLNFIRNKEESAIPLFNLVKINKKTGDNKNKKDDKYLEKLKKLSKKSELAKAVLLKLN